MQNPQTHVRRDGGQDRFTSYTLHAAESLIDEHETSRPESLLQLVRSLVHQAYDRLSDEPELERITPVAKWEIVKEFIDAHLHEPLTRDDVAAAIDVHPNHLSRFVKMFSGTSYATHLRQKRMKRATELLCAYDIPIYEVAKRCGYPSPANFSNAFRQSFQCSPGTYRKDAAPPA